MVRYESTRAMKQMALWLFNRTLKPIQHAAMKTPKAPSAAHKLAAIFLKIKLTIPRSTKEGLAKSTILAQVQFSSSFSSSIMVFTLGPFVVIEAVHITIHFFFSKASCFHLPVTGSVVKTQPINLKVVGFNLSPATLCIKCQRLDWVRHLPLLDSH